MQREHCYKKTSFIRLLKRNINKVPDEDSRKIFMTAFKKERGKAAYNGLLRMFYEHYMTRLSTNQFRDKLVNACKDDEELLDLLYASK